MAAAATAAAAAVAAGLCLGQTATARLNQQRAALGGGGGGGGSVSARAVAATTALTAGLVADARPPRGGAAGGAAGVMAGGDQVAVWEVPLQDGLHRIEFEHGTTSGKRVLRVDGSEILRRDWMFKLVGDEEFAVGGARCVLRVEPVGGFSYSYELLVNGRSFEAHADLMNRATKTWAVHIGADAYRVVLERDTLDVWANGQKLETTGEFVEDGTETHFTLGDTPAYIKAVTSGKRREGLVHSLVVGETVIAPLRAA